MQQCVYKTKIRDMMTCELKRLMQTWFDFEQLRDRLRSRVRADGGHKIIVYLYYVIHQNIL